MNRRLASIYKSLPPLGLEELLIRLKLEKEMLSTAPLFNHEKLRTIEADMRMCHEALSLHKPTEADSLEGPA